MGRLLRELGRAIRQRDHVHRRDLVTDAKFDQAETVRKDKRVGDFVRPVPNILQIQTSFFISDEPLHTCDRLQLKRQRKDCVVQSVTRLMQKRKASRMPAPKIQRFPNYFTISSQFWEKIARGYAGGMAQFTQRAFFYMRDRFGNFFHVSGLATLASIRDRRKERAVRLEHQPIERRGGDGVADQ